MVQLVDLTRCVSF
ncbi:hypothetical protein NY802_004084 [Escherichia coli]|nr:hypothetical protein [Escherichia coli]MCA4864516.1 hypothetical protein [Escherichia coli]